MSIEMIEVEGFNAGTQIKVIGVGGGGGNAVEHMIKSGVKGVEFVCANTDAQALRTSSAHRVIQLGQSGLGAGSKPERGREAAEMAVEVIREVLEGNLCRCTGYQNIVKAVQHGAVAMQA
jgi:cell division protein FtsZ